MDIQVSIISLLQMFLWTSFYIFCAHNHFLGGVCAYVSALGLSVSPLYYNIVDMYKKTPLCFEHMTAMSGGQADVQQEIWNVEYSTSEHKRLVEKIEYNYQRTGCREERSGPWV